MHQKNVNKKIAIITGGNGQLGQAIITDLLKRDFKVFSLDTKISKSAISADLVYYHKVDITSEVDVNKFFKKFKFDGNKIDVVINNAGIGTFEPFRDRTKNIFMKVLEVNLFGTFNIIKNSIDCMVDNPRVANIINIGSIYGIVSSDPNIYSELKRMNSEVYSASKAGIIQMTKYFAVHLSDKNICVNTISPGGIFNNHPDTFIKKYSTKTPLGRMADVEEISHSVMFFCENQNRYLTGQNLVVDGGLSSW